MILIRQKIFASNIVRQKQKLVNLESKISELLKKGKGENDPEVIKLRLKLSDNYDLYNYKLSQKK